MGWGIWGPALAMLAILAILVFRDTIGNRAPVLTGRGTVLRRSVTASHVSTGLFGRERQLYQITFRLSDGEELTLYVPEKAYLTLEAGLTGTLVWQGDSLREFVPQQKEEGL